MSLFLSDCLSLCFERMYKWKTPFARWPRFSAFEAATDKMPTPLSQHAFINEALWCYRDAPVYKCCSLDVREHAYLVQTPAKISSLPFFFQWKLNSKNPRKIVTICQNNCISSAYCSALIWTNILLKSQHCTFTPTHLYSFSLSSFHPIAEIQMREVREVDRNVDMLIWVAFNYCACRALSLTSNLTTVFLFTVNILQKYINAWKAIHIILVYFAEQSLT